MGSVGLEFRAYQCYCSFFGGRDLAGASIKLDGRAIKMGKGRDRGPRRRGFEDDNYSPPPRHDERPQPAFRRGPRENSAPSGPPIDAVVKWFNADKGLRCGELADGSGDAFLHVAALQSAGHDAVEPETKMSVQVGQGQKGRQVTAVLSVDASSGGAPRAASRPPSRGSFGRGGGGGGRETPETGNR